jgi:hypothetical protein
MRQKADESKPRSEAEARQHVLEGLVRAVQGCSYLTASTNDPIARNTGQVVDLLWAAFRGRDPDLCAEIGSIARRFRTKGVSLPVGESFAHKPALAKRLVAALDAAKAANDIKVAVQRMVMPIYGMEISVEPHSTRFRISF